MGHKRLSTGPCAQIAGDGSLGTVIYRFGNDWKITAGTQLGDNLFHSFSQFGIPTGNSATFSGPNSVSIVIGRVTGGAASSIDGMLRSTILGANLPHVAHAIDRAHTFVWTAGMGGGMSGFVFIHSRIANIEQLIAGLDGDVQVVVLNPTQPGVTQIVTALAVVTNLDFVHHASA